MYFVYITWYAERHYSGSFQFNKWIDLFWCCWVFFFPFPCNMWKSCSLQGYSSHERNALFTDEVKLIGLVTVTLVTIISFIFLSASLRSWIKLLLKMTSSSEFLWLSYKCLTKADSQVQHCITHFLNVRNQKTGSRMFCVL